MCGQPRWLSGNVLCTIILCDKACYHWLCQVYGRAPAFGGHKSCCHCTWVSPMSRRGISTADDDRIVRTPLWTDYPEKMEQFGYSMKNSVSAEDVAMAMIDSIVDGKYVGGDSLSVSTGGIRILKTWNLENPRGDSTSTALPKEVLEKNYAPVVATMKRERARMEM